MPKYCVVGNVIRLGGKNHPPGSIIELAEGDTAGLEEFLFEDSSTPPTEPTESKKGGKK